MTIHRQWLGDAVVRVCGGIISVSQHGADVKLTDLLVTLADCHKVRTASAHERCRAVYDRLNV